MRIREATVADAAAIAAVHVRGWQHAYRGILGDDFLDGIPVVERTAGWTRALTAGEAPTLLSVTAERVTGFACVSASRDDDRHEGVGELVAIYVDPGEQGTGAGRALMTAALDRLRERHTEATLWVLARNERAQRFYRAAGWHFDGTTKDVTVGGTPVTEHRYRRAL